LAISDYQFFALSKYPKLANCTVGNQILSNRSRVICFSGTKIAKSRNFAFAFPGMHFCHKLTGTKDDRLNQSTCRLGKVLLLSTGFNVQIAAYSISVSKQKEKVQKSAKNRLLKWNQQRTRVKPSVD
jgi:hypothetical protein